MNFRYYDSAAAVLSAAAALTIIFQLDPGQRDLTLWSSSAMGTSVGLLYGLFKRRDLNRELDQTPPSKLGWGYVFFLPGFCLTIVAIGLAFNVVPIWTIPPLLFYSGSLVGGLLRAD